AAVRLARKRLAGRSLVGLWARALAAPSPGSPARGLDRADHMVEQEDVVATRALQQDGPLVEGADAPGDAMPVDQEDFHRAALAAKAVQPRELHPVGTLARRLAPALTPCLGGGLRRRLGRAVAHFRLVVLHRNGKNAIRAGRLHSAAHD